MVPHSLTSLLHYASISGWEDTINLLLDHGADPRQTCMTGETALHFAVSLQHAAAAETLLKRSQDLVNEADKVSALTSEASQRYVHTSYSYLFFKNSRHKVFEA